MTKHYTKNELGKRVNELRAAYSLNCSDFGFRCGLSGVAVYNLERGKSTTMKNGSVEKIVGTYGTTKDWLLLGEGEMLPKGKIVIDQKKDVEEKLKLIELKIKNTMLEREVERLWRMLGNKLESALSAKKQ